MYADYPAKLHATSPSSDLLMPLSQLSFSTLNAVVFRNYAEANVGRKFLSLFPGLGYAAGYKILQRIYKSVWFSNLVLRSPPDADDLRQQIWRATVCK